MEREVFIKKAQERHGDEYVYDNLPQKVLYSDTVGIICRKHGVFYQNAGNHLRSGCPHCYGTKRKTTEQFIQEARLVHGNKYDYSITKYEAAYKKVEIICPEHGVFIQEASSHIRGCGCPKCVRIVIDKTEDFVRKAKEIYGDEYTYEKTKYTNGSTSLIVTHKDLGDISVNPLNFLKKKTKTSSIDQLEGEEWRDVVGLEQYYQVSNKGRVRSKDRKCRVNKHGECIYKGKIINGITNKQGYIRMTLKMRPKSVAVFLHRLVAQAFLPNEDNLPFVNHKDENPLNNCVENLEWCTKEYNNTYGTAIQRAKITRAKSGASTLVEKVDSQGNVVERFMSIAQAAKENHVKRDVISYAIKTKRRMNGYVYRKSKEKS